MPDCIASPCLNFLAPYGPGQGSADPGVIWVCLFIPVSSSCKACSEIRFCKAPPKASLLLAIHTLWAGPKAFIFCLHLSVPGTHPGPQGSVRLIND